MPTYGSFRYSSGHYGVSPSGVAPAPPVAPGQPAPAPTPLALPSFSLANVRLQRNLPVLYADGSTTRLLAAAAAAEMDLVYDALVQIQAQGFVMSATWGIQYWEALLGMRVAPDVTLGSRRAAVLAALATAGPVTLASIHAFTARFRLGTINITYIPQLWSLSVEFADFRGLPPDLPQLQQGLDALVPAWLSLVYQFRFTTYGELKGWGLTYRQIRQFQLTYSQIKTWAPSGAGASQPGNTAATFSQSSGGIVAQTQSTAATFAQPSIIVGSAGGAPVAGVYGSAKYGSATYG